MPFWSNAEKQNLFDDEDNTDIQVTSQPFTRDDILICATRGHIYAVHKTDGSDIWHTRFPTGVCGSVISIFITDSDKLIVGGQGKTACMNLMNGRTIWVNNMEGCTDKDVTVLSTPSLNSRFSPDRLLLREEPIYNEEDVPERPIIISCMAGGECTGIDGFTGSTLWTYDCPGGKQRIPTAILEPPNVQKGRPKGLVYVGAGKTLYCLKTKTGDLQWKKKISHCMFGYSFMTMATPWSSRVAAETHSAFSQNPVAQVRDMQRDAEHVNHVY